jgi:hypothetical protein
MAATPLRERDTGVDIERDCRRRFVVGQVRGLQPLDFVTFVTPSSEGFAFVEVSHDEDGKVSTVEVGAAPALSTAVPSELAALGFTERERGSGLRWQGSGADQVASLVTSVLDGPLAVAADAPLDVHHGSRRAQVERQRKLTRIRERLRAVVESFIGAEEVTEDADGDLVFKFESTRVFVGARVLANTEIIVRVFALAAVDVDPSPALGLYLAQANFKLAIGKFSLDSTHRIVWFEEDLLGESFTDEELRRIVELVAMTTSGYDDQLAHMFGGRTAREATGDGEDAQEEREKPGSSGYL